MPVDGRWDLTWRLKGQASATRRMLTGLQNTAEDSKQRRNCSVRFFDDKAENVLKFK